MKLKTLMTRLGAPAAVAALVLGTAVPAAAQASRLGGTFTVSQDGGTHRFPAVAYDAAHDAYLVAWNITDSPGLIRARYVSGSGAALGSQNTINDPYNPLDSSPRQSDGVGVGCAPQLDACLVAWLEERHVTVNGTGQVVSTASALVGRLVRFNGGSVDFLTAPAIINQNGLPKYFESAPSVAYAPTANEFLVTWTEYDGGGGAGGPDIKAQRVNAGGQPTGIEVTVSNTADWEGIARVQFNSAQNEFGVSFYCEGASPAVCGQRVQPGTGVLIGGRSVLYSGVFEGYPALAYNTITNQYLAITWSFSGNNWMIHGRLTDGSVQPFGNVLSLAAFGGGDGIGVAYNPVGNNYLGVFQSQANGEVWGVAVSSTGTAGAAFQVTASGTDLSPQPTAAASTGAANWLGVTSTHFRSSVGNMVQNSGGSTTTGGSTGGTTTTSSCTTVQPASDWTCVNGNWLPPGSGSTTSTSSCSTASPGAGWTCVNGNWLPPSTTTSTSSCTTVQPASDWTCVNGNWLPPGSGTTTSTSSCSTASPGAGWTCVNGNWLPPTTTTSSSSCTTVQPASDWVCVNGDWLPPALVPAGFTSSGSTSTSSCTTVQPGPGWTCVSGNWLPPTMPVSDGTCSGTAPASDWVCKQGNWLPPGHPLLSGGL